MHHSNLKSKFCIYILFECFLFTSLLPSYALALKESDSSLTAEKTFLSAPGYHLRQRSAAEDGGTRKTLAEEISGNAVPITARFDGSGGWIKTQGYAGWLEKIREILKTKVPHDDEAIIVYYYGIGGGISSHQAGAENIDIVSPLLATDFTHLVSFDKARGNFASFKSKVKKEIGNIQGVTLRDEDLRQLEEQHFRVTFTYQGKERTVDVFYDRDAAREFPEGLAKGYHVLYSRGMPVVFRDMDRSVRRRLYESLIPGKGMMVLENFVTLPLSVEGFRRLDVGEASWAGKVRRLDVFEKPSSRETHPAATARDGGTAEKIAKTLTAQDGGKKQEAVRLRIAHDARQDPAPLIIRYKRDIEMAIAIREHDPGTHPEELHRLRQALNLVERTAWFVYLTPQKVDEKIAQGIIPPAERENQIRKRWKVALFKLYEARELARPIDDSIGLIDPFPTGMDFFWSDAENDLVLRRPSPDADDIPQTAQDGGNKIAQKSPVVKRLRNAAIGQPIPQEAIIRAWAAYQEAIEPSEKEKILKDFLRDVALGHLDLFTALGLTHEEERVAAARLFDGKTLEQTARRFHHGKTVPEVEQLEKSLLAKTVRLVAPKDALEHLGLSAAAREEITRLGVTSAPQLLPLSPSAFSPEAGGEIEIALAELGLALKGRTPGEALMEKIRSRPIAGPILSLEEKRYYEYLRGRLQSFSRPKKSKLTNPHDEELMHHAAWQLVRVVGLERVALMKEESLKSLHDTLVEEATRIRKIELMAAGETLPRPDPTLWERWGSESSDEKRTELLREFVATHVLTDDRLFARLALDTEESLLLEARFRQRLSWPALGNVFETDDNKEVREIEKRLLSKIPRLIAPPDVLESLALTPGTHKTLVQAGIHSVPDLTAKSREELLAIEDVGRVSIDEAEFALAERNLSLWGSTPGAVLLTRIRDRHARTRVFTPAQERYLDQLSGRLIRRALPEGVAMKERAFRALCRVTAWQLVWTIPENRLPFFSPEAIDSLHDIVVKEAAETPRLGLRSSGLDEEDDLLRISLEQRFLEGGLEPDYARDYANTFIRLYEGSIDKAEEWELLTEEEAFDLKTANYEKFIKDHALKLVPRLQNLIRTYEAMGFSRIQIFDMLPRLLPESVLEQFFALDVSRRNTATIVLAQADPERWLRDAPPIIQQVMAHGYGSDDAHFVIIAQGLSGISTWLTKARRIENILEKRYKIPRRAVRRIIIRQGLGEPQTEQGRAVRTSPLEGALRWVQRAVREVVRPMKELYKIEEDTIWNFVSKWGLEEALPRAARLKKRVDKLMRKYGWTEERAWREVVNESLGEDDRLSQVEKIVSRLTPKLGRKPNLREVGELLPDFRTSPKPGDQLGKWFTAHGLDYEDFGLEKFSGRAQQVVKRTFRFGGSDVYIPPQLSGRIKIVSSKALITAETRIELASLNDLSVKLTLEIVEKEVLGGEESADGGKKKFLRLTYTRPNGETVQSEIPLPEKLTSVSPSQLLAFQLFYDRVFGIPEAFGPERESAVAEHLKTNGILNRQNSINFYFHGQLHFPHFYATHPGRIEILRERGEHARWIVYRDVADPNNFVGYEWREGKIVTLRNGEPLTAQLEVNAKAGKFPVYYLNRSPAFGEFDQNLKKTREVEILRGSPSIQQQVVLGPAQFLYRPAQDLTVVSFEGTRGTSRDDRARYPILFRPKGSQEEIRIAYRDPQKGGDEFVIDGLTREDGSEIFLKGHDFNLSYLLEQIRRGLLPGIHASKLLQEIFEYRWKDRHEKPPRSIRLYRIDETNHAIVSGGYVDPITFAPWPEDATASDGAHRESPLSERSPERQSRDGGDRAASFFPSLNHEKEAVLFP